MPSGKIWKEVQKKGNDSGGKNVGFGILLLFFFFLTVRKFAPFSFLLPLVGLGFELRASCLQIRHSAT
jgi:hypothetical protein